MVESNSPLIGPILFWLRGHLLKQCDLEALPPLRFSDIVVTQGNDAVLQEPIGALIYLIQQVVEVAKDREDELDSRTLTQITDVLDKLLEGMGRCNLENFDLVSHCSLQNLLLMWPLLSPAF